MSYLTVFNVFIKNVARSPVKYKGMKKRWIFQRSEECVKL